MNRIAQFPTFRELPLPADKKPFWWQEEKHDEVERQSVLTKLGLSDEEWETLKALIPCYGGRPLLDRLEVAFGIERYEMLTVPFACVLYNRVGLTDGEFLWVAEEFRAD